MDNAMETPKSSSQPEPQTTQRQTIHGLLSRVFPEGTNKKHKPQDYAEPIKDDGPLSSAPCWPPDLFAAMALLIERSGCYTHPAFIRQNPEVMSKLNSSDGKKQTGSNRIHETASGYRYCWKNKTGTCGSTAGSSSCSHPEFKSRPSKQCYWTRSYGEIQHLWDKLISIEDGKYTSEDIGSFGPLRFINPPPWSAYAMELFEIADRACEKVGFVRDLNEKERSSSPIADHIGYNQQRAYAKEHEERGSRVANITDIEGDYKDTNDVFAAAGKKLKDKLKADGEEIDFIQLPYLPSSICYAVPDYFACVQPKANTPQVGYSLRSFSHHLALLPRVGEVSSQWFDTFGASKATKNPTAIENGLNLLLVPYPYFMDALNFSPVEPVNEVSHKFKVEQNWLMDLLTAREKDQIKMKENEERKQSPDGAALEYTNSSKWQKAKIQSTKIRDGIMKLVEEAKKNVGTIHGVILPEMALSYEVAELTSTFLFDQHPLQFFISGVTSERPIENGQGSRPVNSVFTRLKIKLLNAEEPVHVRRIQVKHHQWILTKSQIIRYSLGARLDPEEMWYEDNDMIERESLFWVFHPEMVMTSLICEDLARIDPVQQVIRAIAPNLVVALLMDGPQTAARWSSRYASALSDDPGCGVLTLTSLGMIRRDALAERGRSPIAIWKDSEGNTKELLLPDGAAALTITLSEKKVSETAASGRKKGDNSSRKLYLSAVQPVPKPRDEKYSMFQDVDRTL